MFEPNLFDYSVFELGLPDGQYTMFLMRINKETGEKQEHHFQQGWRTLTDENFAKLLSLAEKYNVTEITDKNVFVDALGYINYNQYLGENLDVEYVEYDDLTDEERAMWCVEHFSDPDEIVRMVDASNAEKDAMASEWIENMLAGNDNPRTPEDEKNTEKRAKDLLKEIQ